MKILLVLPDNTEFELVKTQARNNDGDPVGPNNLRQSETPGIVKREYIGKTRIEPEDVRVHSGSITFDVHREFSTVDGALDYLVDRLSDPTEGKLVFVKHDGTRRTVFEKAAVSTSSVANVGCSVAVSYTIEG